MQHKWKRTLSLLLVLAMVFTMVPVLGQTVLAKEEPNYETIQQLLDRSTFQQETQNGDDEVVFLVELDQKPLLDTVPQGQTLMQYMESRNGSLQLNAMQEQQSVMAAKIQNEHLEITNTYTYAFNGFAVEGTYQDLEALESLEGVKQVVVAGRYELPQPQDAQEPVITSGSMINSDSANEEGYTGKGTVVAILDTGLDVQHPAFAGSVESATFTKEFVAQKVAEGALPSGATAEDLYKSDKIPFAYDYADKDADVSDANSHGTHVAGTVGANSDKLRGVAPDAQLVIMKVFSDKNAGAGDQDILAALEDCVVLGVDAANMSLGTPCGFTNDGDLINSVYDRVKKAGVNLMVAAGNDQSAAYHNLMGTDLALVGNPDYGIVGAPSTYDAALSVASVNEMMASMTAFLLGDQKILYADSAEDSAKMFYSLEGTYEYVCVTGVGNVNDFKKADVKGKIAVVERGEIAFTEKEKNAKNAGAAGLVVYDNVDGPLFRMQLDGLLPAASVTKASGKLLRDAATKSISVSKKHCGPVENPEGGLMSSFSSIGVAPDLTLKPEITAPGGNVYSTLPGGQYGEMSGTSMACPHMAGAAAVMQQYVDQAFAGKTEIEKRAIINNLLMSTAVPVKDREGVAYTPRKQGAGLTNVHGAIHSGAYLTVNGQERPKAELRDNAEGSFSFTFTVENFSDTEKTYTVGAMPLVAKVETVKGHQCISDHSRLLTQDEFTVAFSKDTVTVPAHGNVSVEVTMALTQAGKDALKVFPNGIYLDGFITLTAPQGGVNLGLPYLGYYGDWGKAPIFDASSYENNGKDAFLYPSSLAMMDYNGKGQPLGINIVTEKYHADKIAYGSHNAGYYLITPMLGLLRAPKELTYSAYANDNPETPVYTYTKSNAMKSFFYAQGNFIFADFVPWEKAWQPMTKGEQGAPEFLPDGSYTYTVTGKVDGTIATQSTSFQVEIDNEAPHVVKTTYTVEDGTPYVTIDVQDNHYVMAVQLVDEESKKALSDIIPVEEEQRGAVTSLKFDMTKIQEQGIKICRVMVLDYAMNILTSDMISTDSQDIEAQKVQINNYSITARTDSANMEVQAFVYPENAVDTSLTWHSTNEEVVKIVSVSEDTHTATISFEGAGHCDVVATAKNGVSGTADVTVTALMMDWPEDHTIRKNGTYQIPANLSKTITITDEAHDVWLIGNAANSGSAPYSNLTIDSKNDNLHLTIQDLHISNDSSCRSSAIVFTGTGNTLKLAGDNTMTAHNYCSKAMISVAPGVELSIEGAGTLHLNSEAYCDGAGIGGHAGKGSGKITVNSGHFDINGTGGGAAIGAGANNADTEILINNGTFDIDMSLRNEPMSNLSVSGAAIGSGYYANDGTTKITINNGSFTGFTQVNSAIIGTGHKSHAPASLVLEINDGTFDLTTENKDESALNGGACIGVGTPQGSEYLSADITINGGKILATSKSCAAAIGGGVGSPTGNIYLNGGTITAIAQSKGDAIGKGAFGKDGNIRINGGSVKAVSSGTGAAFGDETLVNVDSDPVYLVNIPCSNAKRVTVNGKDWKIPANHPADDQLYLWLPAAENVYEVIVEGDKTVSYEVSVNADGTPEISTSYNVTCTLEHMTSDAPATVKGGAALTVKLTPDEGYSLPETMEVTMGGEAVDAYTDGVVTIKSVSGDVVIHGSAIQHSDKTKLNELLAKELKEEDYTADSWAQYQAARKEAQAVADNPTAAQADVDAAVTALKEAEAKLVLRGNKTQLKKVIAEAEALKKDQYTADTWDKVAKALEQAKAVDANENAAQAEVDAAAAALEEAIKGLLPNTDKTQLKQDIASVELAMSRLCEEVLDATLWANTEKALADAKAVDADASAIQDAVDAADRALMDAFQLLMKDPVCDMYQDVPETAWFYDSVDFVTRFGMMDGIADHRFGPASNLTRGQLVTILYRLEGSPAVSGEMPFTDVNADRFYADAVLWAYETKLTDGIGNGLFAPSSRLTRQQLVTFMMRYAEMHDVDTTKRADLSSYADHDKVMDFAGEAMQWAVAEKLVEGVSDNRLAPASTANRSQGAAILARLCEKILWK